MLLFHRLFTAAVCAVFLNVGAGCRRAAPDDSQADRHPGLDPKPTGRALWDGAPIPDPERGTIDLSRREPEGLNMGLPAADDWVHEVHEAAGRGEAWAQVELGKKYVTEADNAERVQLGIDLLQRAAAQKDAEAAQVLAGLAASGMESQPSGITAMENLRVAADLGNADAQFELAVSLANSSASPAVAEESLSWARKAATQGHAGAQHAAGVSLLRRAASSQNIKEGLAFLEMAAAQNHREALMVLAGILTRGEFGLAKDQTRAEALLKPRAEGGDPEFQFGLGTLYLYGGQLLTREEQGKQWLRKSAEAGFGEAKDLLEKISQNEQTPGK